MCSLVPDDHKVYGNIHKFLDLPANQSVFYFYYGTQQKYNTYQWLTSAMKPRLINEYTQDSSNKFCIMEILKYLFGIAKQGVLVVIYYESALPAKYYHSNFLMLPAYLLKHK